LKENESSGCGHGAVIFDLDGTLTRPNLDFDLIRREIGVEGPILEALDALGPSARGRAEAILVRHEDAAARCAVLQRDAADVVRACRAGGFPVAILTRNARSTVDIVLGQNGMAVDAVRSREDGAIKPSPEQILSICRELNCDPRQSWMVGDYLFDIISGEEAGSRTILMIGDNLPPEYAARADHVIRNLTELLAIVGVARA